MGSSNLHERLLACFPKARGCPHTPVVPVQALASGPAGMGSGAAALAPPIFQTRRHSFQEVKKWPAPSTLEQVAVASQARQAGWQALLMLQELL